MKLSVPRRLVLASVPFALIGCQTEAERAQEQFPTEIPGAEAPAREIPTRAELEESVQALETRLSQARARIASDPAGAAAQLRQAASTVEQTATTATGERQERLTRAAQGLNRLADEVEQGAVTTQNDLDREYVHVHRELAHEYAMRAREAAAQRDAQQLAQNLRVSAWHIQQALAYAGREGDVTSRTVVRDTEQMAQRVQEGAEWTQEELDQLVERIRQELERLAREVEASRYTTQSSTAS